MDWCNHLIVLNCFLSFCACILHDYLDTISAVNGAAALVLIKNTGSNAQPVCFSN